MAWSGFWPLSRAQRRPTNQNLEGGDFSLLLLCPWTLRSSFTLLFFLFWPRAGWNKCWRTNSSCKYFDFKMIWKRAFGEGGSYFLYLLFLPQLGACWVSTKSPQEHEPKFLLFWLPVLLSPLHETSVWVCRPFAFACLEEILFLPGCPPFTCTWRVACSLVSALVLCPPSHFLSNISPFLNV